jgi:hypothetical protein
LPQEKPLLIGTKAMSVIAEKIAARNELGMTADQFNSHLRNEVARCKLQFKLAMNRVFQACANGDKFDSFADKSVEAEQALAAAIANAEKFGVK